MNDKASAPAFRTLLGPPVRHPIITLAVSALITILAVYAVSRLRPTGSLESMIAQDNPAAVALDRVLSNFRSMDDLILLASMRESKDHATGSDDDSSARLLAFAARLEQVINQSTDVHNRVGRISYRVTRESQERQYIEREVIPAGLFYLTDDQFEAFRARLTRREMQEQIRRNEELVAAPGPAADALSHVLLKDPLRLREFLTERLKEHAPPFQTKAGSDAFISQDGRSLLIRISGKRPASDLDFTKLFYAGIQACAERANQEGLLLEYTGSYAIAAASEKSIRGDMIRSVIGSVVLMQLLFLISYRRLFSFVLVFLPAALSIVCAFAVYSLFSQNLTPATAVIGAILSGLGVDYGIQFLAGYQRRTDAGQESKEAALNTAAYLAAPMSASALTTIVGFLVIGLSSVRAMRDFSTIGMLGLAGSMVAALTVLPAMLGIHRGQNSPINQPQRRQRLHLDGVIRFVSRHTRFSIASSIVAWIAVIAILLLDGRPLLPADADLSVMHPQPNPAIELQYTIAKRFGSAPNAMLVHLQAASPDELQRLSHQAANELRRDAVRAVGVQGMFGLHALLPDPRIVPTRMGQLQTIDIDAVIAEFNAVLADSIFSPTAYEDFTEFLRHLLRPSTPPSIETIAAYPELAMSLLPRAAIDGGAAATESITILFLARPLDDRASRDHAIDVIRDALSDIPGATLTGLSVIGHDTELSIKRELGRMLGVAIAAIAAIILMFFHRFPDLLLTFLPIAFGVTCLLLTMHLCDDGLNPINLIGLPMLLGSGIDYGIYVISIARQARLAGQSSAELSTAFGAGIHALTISAMTNVLGYGSLVFTSTPAIQSLGRMLAVSMAGCLAATLFLLVPILVTLARRQERLNTDHTNSSNETFTP